jgi:Flp pilus assembly protein TadG
MLKHLVQRDGGAGDVGERGSIAVFTALFAAAVLALLALLVGGGSALNAKERADDIAEQAALAAANDVNIAALRVNPADVTIDWNTACGYATQVVREYSADASDDVLSATVVSCGEPGAGNVNPGENPVSTAMVSVQVTTKPVFPGFPSLTMTATQTATIDCGNALRQFPQEVC